MRGKHRIQVSNRTIKYDFTIKRNITVIQGDSATGKTTLVNMLDAYSVDMESSGIQVVSDVPIFVYTVAGAIKWQDLLKYNEGSIVFIDVDYDFISSREFAKYIQHSDSYYVLITRENLENLPYSVEEIYRIKESGKYGTAYPVYNIFENIYQCNKIYHRSDVEWSEVSYVVTEDSKAGYQFWKTLCDSSQMICESAKGKSNIAKYLKENCDQSVFAVVDGAAFGSQMRRTSQIIENADQKKLIVLFLPESFEWLLLKAGLVPDISGLKDILDNTFDYVDSKQFMSWERFFTSFLVEKSAGRPYQYHKEILNEYFKGEKIIEQVKKEFPVLAQIFY